MRGNSVPHGKFSTGVPMLMLSALLLTAMQALSGEPAPEVKVEFNEQGLSALRSGDQNMLSDGRVTLRKIVVTDRYRNRNEETDDKAYAGEDRTFTDASAEVQRSSFDQQQRRLLQQFAWGAISVTYLPRANGLDITVEVQNTSDKVIEHVSLILMELAFAAKPEVGMLSSIPDWARSGCNIDGPEVARARWPSGQLMFVSLQPGRPLGQKIEKRGDNKLALSVAAGDERGGREVYDGVWNTRPIRPGEKDSYGLSLRFCAADADPYESVGDVLRRFGEAFPLTNNWPDRRPIAAIHVADNRTSEANPRGWKHAASVPNDWNVNAEGSREAFRQALVRSAERIVEVCRGMGAQGIIVWQIEGEQFSGSVYYGEPRLVQRIAPEMQAAADDFFRKLREGGLRVGVCIRPTIHFARDAAKKDLVPWDKLVDLWARNWVGEIPDFYKDLYGEAEAKSALNRLDAKIRYAQERWGCTLFYIDTNHFWRPRDRSKEGWDWQSRMMPAAVFEELHKRHPDVLLVPEHESLRYWTSTAPYVQPPQWGRKTERDIRLAYPNAFSVISMNDQEHIRQKREEYVEAIISGDVLLPAGWYPGNTDVVREVYEAAAKAAPFQVRAAEDGLKLNDEAVADAKALQQALAQRLKDRPQMVRERRVAVTYRQKLKPEDLNAILKAVADAGGVIAWTDEIRGK